MRALLARDVSSQQHDERQLVTQILAGDQAAAAELFHQNRDAVFKVARAITGSDDAALDVTQDTFVRGYAHLSSWRGSASLKTWLTRIAVRLAIDTRRKAAERATAADVEDLSHDPRPEIERSVLLARVQRLAMEVDGRPGVALRIRLFAGLSNREIAEVLETTEANVRMQLSRAVSELRKRV